MNNRFLPFAPNASWRRDCLWLFILTGLLFCIGLGLRAYLTPSEARYIEIPRQILTTGDWLTPRINGVPYFEKPPLFYWMQAGIMGLFGNGEFAGRIVTVVLMCCTCLVTYSTGRLLYGRLAGLLAAIALATSLMGYGLSRVATLDVPVSLFISACLAAFLAAQRLSDSKQRGRFYLLMYVASALATMSKGLIGIVVPGMVIGAWIALTGRWRIIAQARLPLGLAVFLIIAAPWHVLMARAHPAFLDFYFVHEHFTRYMTDEHKRTAPWWFFLAVILIGLLPWTGLLPATLKSFVTTAKPAIQWRTPRAEHSSADSRLFLLLWIALPLLFYSASHSKLIPYIFPIFPPLAVMIGHILAEYWEGRRAVIELRLAAFAVIVLFGVLLTGGQMALMLMHSGKASYALDMLSQISLSMVLPALVALLCIVFVALSKRPAHQLILTMAAFGGITGLSVNYLAAQLDTSSVKPLALALKPVAQPDDMVVAYGSYWQDLPVYLERNVMVADWTGELGFGVEHYPKTHAWMMPADEFWARCGSTKHHVYVFMRATAFANLTQPENGLGIHEDCRLRIMANYGNTVLLEKDAP